MRASIDNAKLDAQLRAFKRSIDRLAKLTSDDSGKILWKYSSQFAAQLVTKTTPRGTAAKAQKIGKAAVARDIDRAYAKPGRIYSVIKQQSQELADVFYAAWMEGDTNLVVETLRKAEHKVRSIPVVPFDGGRSHSNARKGRGRVRANYSEAVLVEKATAHNVRRYIHEKQEKVGYTKSGWIRGFAPPSGVKGIPNWVKSNNAPGRVVDKTRFGFVKSIDFENHVPWIRNNFNGRAAIQALNWVVKRIEKDIEKAVVDNAKKV